MVTTTELKKEIKSLKLQNESAYNQLLKQVEVNNHLNGTIELVEKHRINLNDVISAQEKQIIKHEEVIKNLRLHLNRTMQDISTYNEKYNRLQRIILQVKKISLTNRIFNFENKINKIIQQDGN
jgi:hypothetical protein